MPSVAKNTVAGGGNPGTARNMPITAQKTMSCTTRGLVSARNCLNRTSASASVVMGNGAGATMVAERVASGKPRILHRTGSSTRSAMPAGRVRRPWRACGCPGPPETRGRGCRGDRPGRCGRRPTGALAAALRGTCTTMRSGCWARSAGSGVASSVTSQTRCTRSISRPWIVRACLVAWSAPAHVASQAPGAPAASTHLPRSCARAKGCPSARVPASAGAGVASSSP